MRDRRIAFIGGGNMAGSLVGGLLVRGWEAGQIRVSDPSTDARARFRALGVYATDSNHEVVADTDIVVLAVKPQQMQAVCEDIAAAVTARAPLLISIAAGIETASLQAWLGEMAVIVRCMPNTPALLQCGATVLYAGPEVHAEARRTAHQIMDSIGYAAWVDREDLLHAVTALSGSGPAYFFLVMEAMQRAGETLGLEPELSRLLTAQTALGAARMALESDADVSELRRRVTSPGGTTERALRVFENRGLRAVFESAINAAAQRSLELAGEIGKP